MALPRKISMGKMGIEPRPADLEVDALTTRARMHHKVVGNFGSEADVRSLHYQRFRFNEISDVGACTHGRPAK